MILGNNLLIYANGSVVAAAKTCRISTDAELIACASATDGDFRAFKVGKSSWQISVTSLVTNVRSWFETPDAAIRVSFVVRDEYGTLMGDRMTGQAIVKKAEVSASVGSLMQGQFTFLGTGALARMVDGLRDYDTKDLYDYNGINRLQAPSSTL
jgi:hypothetical protein